MRSITRTHARRWLRMAGLLLPVLPMIFLCPKTAAQDRPGDPFLQGQGTLKVMTYNMYAGTEYDGVTNPDYDSFLQAVTALIENVRTSDPPTRVRAIAGQIAAAHPDIVSLQEVATWSTGQWTGTSCSSLTLEFDYLQLLLDALAAEGTPYAPVATVTHFDVTMPASDSACVRNTWRVAIISRADLNPEDLFFSHVQAAPFTSTFKIPIPALGILLPFPRGWVAADVMYRNKQFRIIAAHLDSLSTSKEIAQGLELLTGPAATSLPVIVAGDLNTPDPTGPTTYNNFTKAGFAEAWNSARSRFDSGYSGYTKPYPSPMNQRGDLVLVRGRFQVQAAAVLCGGSDHCGVVARLQLPELN
jgi:endonuclease/exonuclease/phosphatase family metal-dependent hydrolase